MYNVSDISLVISLHLAILIQHWYCNLTSQVKLGKNLSRSFSLARGIRQGSGISGLLEIIAIVMLYTILRDNLGCKVHDRITTLAES